MSNVPGSPPEDALLDHRHSTCIVPFYSSRTLEQEHVLIKDLRNSLAVYLNAERTLATIGTRGVRPFDGANGLIVHVHVHRAANDLIEVYSHGLVEPAFYNLEHTPAATDELLELLMNTLQEAGIALQK